MMVVDIETTGMDPERNSIVSIGAVDFDNPKNTFYAECRVEEGLAIDPVALQINGFRLDQIMDPKKPEIEGLLKDFVKWSKKIDERVLAGDNIWFDTGFLRENSG
jgi:DNA polymerase III epsilon subunit-like protein